MQANAPETTQALPGIQERIKLPRPPNFLSPANNPNRAIPIGKLQHQDATLLALGMARQVLAHHRERWEQEERLSPREAEELPHASLVTDAIVERIANRTAVDWRLESAEFKVARREGIRLAIELFLEDIAR